MNKMHQPERANHRLDQIERGSNHHKNNFTTSPIKDNEITSNYSKNSPTEKKNETKSTIFSLCRWVFGLLFFFGSIIVVIFVLRKYDWHPFSVNKKNNNQITQVQLLEHNTRTDCWMVLHGKVYDLTEYAQRHPGGSDIITDLCGSDATTAYDMFHSENLLLSINNELIGNIQTVSDNGSVATDLQMPTTTSSTTSAMPDSTSSSSLSSSCQVQRITLDEVQMHDKANDCWMVIYGKVYDLTDYALRHPAGATIITNLAGTDATNEYSRFHRESLMRRLQGDVVGILPETSGINTAPCDSVESFAKPSTTTVGFKYTSDSDGSSSDD